ncbi:chemotaxis protein CheY [Synechococcus sp. 60AY4M2]|jgi:twitching motility two-component system response regulator PilH|nr:chemotaxis protein CheY [Synechococcus sp. 65AY6A5]PIK95907.1 chemotaxis protein CheY [Synechococcus sp. 60AY4M2]PIK98146.1 chemotaxis protein CheY [Synechococcus sp. 63AY4M1]PIL01129.1 chemotaxis protein CheY [Synechococcus sp. 65AY640]
MSIMVKVLVVEDVASERQLISDYLRSEGYQVVAVANAQEALQQIRNDKPDVVLTDLVMEGMSGLELCRQIKKNPETQKLPVVACTSKNQELDKLWGMKQGIDLYLTKPFTREDILRAVKSVVLSPSS